MRAAIATSLAFVLAGCAIETSQAPQWPTADPRPTASGSRVDPYQAERLQRVMIPLLQSMNRPLPLNRVRIGVVQNREINAANAGGGEFYVTTGLLARASDDQLRGVMAHEIAHADLGHMSRAQTLGAGLTLGAILLDQIIPGSRAITPLAGELVARAYSREEEYAADAHGVTILRRAGYDGRRIMTDTLTWLQQTSGSGGGGFFSTHPATADRIQAIRSTH